MALKNPQAYKGIILFAPAIRDNDANSKFGKKFVGILGSVIPRVELVPQEGGGACRNKLQDEQYFKDPFNYTGKMKPATLKNILN